MKKTIWQKRPNLGLIIQTLLLQIFEIWTKLVQVEILSGLLFVQLLEFLFAFRGRRVASVDVAGGLYATRGQVDLDQDFVFFRKRAIPASFSLFLSFQYT